MASYLFRPPTVDEAPASWDDWMFVRIKLTRGISIQEKPQGTFRALRYPTQDEIAEAFRFWMGGHEYIVDDATRAALLAAGVGVGATNFSTPPGSYGYGGYGKGAYGG